ncbi:MAG: DNA alkylation repair protein [Deltaproteobacteria bacterium]|nr:DNA alkylation repair protein [Deltaproteobacteria bacterium]
MAEPLKNAFNPELVRGIGRELRGAWPAFPERKFVAEATSGLEALELTPRAWHVADVLQAHLPKDFGRAAQVVVASLGPVLDDTEGNGMTPFRYLPHVFWVARYGLGHFEAAMTAQHALTQRFTAEFSIRAYLEAHPELTLDRLQRWASDPSVHVRRLVSEGTRPLLPWAARLQAFRKDPGPVLELLELLKDDPERYVQRSVANNLNDISRDHPDRVVELCRRWKKGAGPGRSYIVGHALRTLVKRGHSGALSVIGFADQAKVRVDAARFSPKVVPIGETLRFNFDVHSTSQKPQSLLVDFRVHFVKAKGQTSPKVFKLQALELPARASATLQGRISFRVHTTRQPYPGQHQLEALINGQPYPLGQFRVK